MGNNLFGKMAVAFRWLKIQPEIKNIKQIHHHVSAKAEKKEKSEQPKKKELREGYEKSKKAYDTYLNLCSVKNVRPPQKREKMERTFYETEVALYGEKDALTKEHERALAHLDVETKILDEIGMRLHTDRKKSVYTIEKVEKFINEIARTEKTFDREFEEIRVNKESFKSAIEFAKEQEKVVVDSVKKSAAEAGAGMIVAKGVPKALAWVATTFGKSSAGTAISALSGAAKTNAALAWLGGGAVAAGGGGVAAGTALLGLIATVGNGITVVSVGVGIIKFITKKIRADENKRKEIESIKQRTFEVRTTADKIRKLSVETRSLERTTAKLRRQCIKLKQKEYTTLSEDEKNMLGTLVNKTKSLSWLLAEVIE